MEFFNLLINNTFLSIGKLDNNISVKALSTSSITIEFLIHISFLKF